MTTPTYSEALNTIMNAAEALATELKETRAVLRRCRTVLGNMAQENEGAIFNRWPINHEPLRADARGLLPVIDAILNEIPAAAPPVGVNEHAAAQTGELKHETFTRDHSFVRTDGTRTP